MAASPAADELAITFSSVTAGGSGEALLDAGKLTYEPRSRRTTSVTRHTFGILIGTASAKSRGTARLSALLQTDDPSCVIRIDGIALGTTPRMIDPHAPVGIVIAHRIEIEVPTSAPERALAFSIGWEASTD